MTGSVTEMTEVAYLAQEGHCAPLATPFAIENDVGV